MKLKIGLLILILGAIATFSLFGTAGAANTGTVSPSVTVGTTLSLIIENPQNVQWEPQSAGSNPTGTIQVRISANANWTLTVKRTSDTSVANCGLMGADGSNFIPASYFTYTSAAGSPTPSGSGVTATQFSTSDTNVWTEGTAIGDCRVAVTYNLQIPASQKPQLYSATHTYTLASS
jgi:hypothetical protein